MLEVKPGFRSYIKQFSIVSYTVKDTDTGVLYEEVKARAHRILWTLAFIIVYAAMAFFLISFIPAAQDAAAIAVYIVAAALVAAAYFVGSVYAVYKISAFEAMGEEEINKYIDIKF